MKKMISLVLCLLLTMSLMSIAFASVPNTTVTITINDFSMPPSLGNQGDIIPGPTSIPTASVTSVGAQVSLVSFGWCIVDESGYYIASDKNGSAGRYTYVGGQTYQEASATSYRYLFAIRTTPTDIGGTHIMVKINNTDLYGIFLGGPDFYYGVIDLGTYENGSWTGGDFNNTPTPTPTLSYDSYVPSGHTVSSDLIGINAVKVDNKLLDPKYYNIIGTSVVLTDEFLKTLKDGKHSIRLENATHVAKGTFIVGNEVIRKGDKGDSVKTLQTLLNNLGFNCGDVDGIFGTKTASAVKKYQAEKSIAVDGIVGSQTWGKLGK